MSFRRRNNRKEAWEEYCIANADVLETIGLHHTIHACESKFREYAKTGYVNDSYDVKIAPSELDDKKFWLLHRFITEYFDMDALLFENYESSRVIRK